MKGKRFTEEQIIAVLREHEAGCRAQNLIYCCSQTLLHVKNS